MASSTSSYRKLFIQEILEKIGDDIPVSEVSKLVMKAHVAGIITGIKHFQQRTMFTVDDGTGSLDCTLWYKEQASQESILNLKKDLNSGITGFTYEAKKCALSLLNQAEYCNIGTESEFQHGDLIHCLGNIKIFRGKPQFDMHHHYKGDSINAETEWIFDVLLTRQEKKY